MKRLNKIALSVMVVVAAGIGFSGCNKDKVSSSNVGNKIVLDSKIALARNDVFVAQRAIEDRVFVYDISAMQLMKPKAPNGESWGEWIMEVAMLDSTRWAVSDLGIYPIDESTKMTCCDESKTPLLWINPRTGKMHFNPSKLVADSNKSKFCNGLKDSYKNAKANGDKIIDIHKAYM